MMIAAGPIALMIAAGFAAAAFYINFAEHPARKRLAPEAAVAAWQVSYRRGFIMQATLAVLAGLAGGVAYLQDRNPQWLVGAGLMLANWPYTLLVMMPVNKALMRLPADQADEEALAKLHAWNRLHMVRTALGVLGAATFLCMMI